MPTWQTITRLIAAFVVALAVSGPLAGPIPGALLLLSGHLLLWLTMSLLGALSLAACG